MTAAGDRDEQSKPGRRESHDRRSRCRAFDRRRARPRPLRHEAEIAVLECDAAGAIGRRRRPDERRFQRSRLGLAALPPVARHGEPIVGGDCAPIVAWRTLLAWVAKAGLFGFQATMS